MTDDSKPTYFELDLGTAEDIEEVVIAFRQGGELYELASVEPPVEAKNRTPAAAGSGIASVALPLTIFFVESVGCSFFS